MRTRRPFRTCFTRRLCYEDLERRLNLGGDGVVDDQATCPIDVTAQGEAARAIQAVNCLAFDLYGQLQHEQGNLVFSPLSIATGLAMTYAGAAGETAAEMAEVLHLGTEPGIHSAFASLLATFPIGAGGPSGYELQLANALWPQAGLAIRDAFVSTIATHYGGQAQGLDYSNPDEAEQVINEWVEQNTRGKVQDLIDQLSPLTAMVLTNSIYFNSDWATPFDPAHTNLAGWTQPVFYREDGTPVNVSMMLSQAQLPYTELDGFQVLEMPFAGNSASMVFVLPQERDGVHELTSELFVKIDNWLQSSREPVWFGGGLQIPKFQIAMSTKLEELLYDMGMPLAFGSAADFSAMTDAPLYIQNVRHKAFLEVNEQGTEAGAASYVELYLCFAAGTPVLTPDGEKPIEELQVGDHVLSRDQHNVEGAIEHKLVEATFHGRSRLVCLQRRAARRQAGSDEWWPRTCRAQ